MPADDTPMVCPPLQPPRPAAIILMYREGGEAPYYATVIPSIGAPGARIQNISIPTGPTHSFRLDQAAGVDYSIVMSDATGFGAGGVTPLLRSGTSGDTSCIGPMVGFDFYFYLTPPGETTQAQCTPLRITWDMSITYPLQLLAVVPGSAAFSIPVPQTPDENSITWDLAVREGAQYQLLMANAGLYGTGGATNLTRVTSGSAACLSEDSPGQGTAQATIVTSITAVPTSSAAGSSSSSIIRSSTSTMRSESTGSSGSSGPDAGAIAGGVVGGVLGLALLILVALCYRRKKRQQAYRETEISKPMRQVSTHRSRSSFDILGRTGQPSTPLPPPPVDQEDPFVSPFPAIRRSESTTGLAGMAEMGQGQGYGSARAPSSDDLPPLVPGGDAGVAGMGAAGAGALGMHGLNSRVQSHQRISSMDTTATRPSRKVSGTFNETAPPTPTVRHSFADAMSAGTAGTAGHPSPSRTLQRLSRARWSVDELGQVPDVPDMQEGEDGRRVIQHQDQDVL